MNTHPTTQLVFWRCLTPISVGFTLPADYRQFVQTPLTSTELKSARNSVNKGVPQGSESWRDAMVDRFKLQATMREKGRPKKCS